MDDTAIRQEIVETAQAMDRAGFAPSKSGNVSMRAGEDFIVTPSGLPYAATHPMDLVRLSLGGEVRSGERRPSSEWPFHAAIYAARPDVQAIVHTHSPKATAFSAARRPIPAFHYMIAMAGGDDIRCADYATFGSPALAANAVKALEGRKAVLLANHGVIACGRTLLGAWTLAQEVENLAGQYLALLASGLDFTVLDAAEMERVGAKFADYGKAG